MAGADTRLIRSEDSAATEVHNDAEVLGDGLVDRVGDGAIDVAWLQEGPGGFALRDGGRAPYAVWAGRCEDEPLHGVFDQLVDPLPTGANGPGRDDASSGDGGLGAGVRVQPRDKVPADEVFTPWFPTVKPAGGAVAWPGAHEG